MTEFDYNELVREVMAKRKAEGHNKDDMAHQLGITRTHLDYIERTNRTFHFRTVLRMCEWLGRPVDAFVRQV